MRIMLVVGLFGLLFWGLSPQAWAQTPPSDQLARNAAYCNAIVDLAADPAASVRAVLATTDYPTDVQYRAYRQAETIAVQAIVNTQNTGSTLEALAQRVTDLTLAATRQNLTVNSIHRLLLQQTARWCDRVLFEAGQ